MTKSIEEQREELAEKYVSLSAPEMTRLQMSWDFKNGFDTGANARDEQWLKVVNELETLYYNNPNIRQDAYNQGVRDCIRRLTKADQMLKDMGVENV